MKIAINTIRRIMKVTVNRPISTGACYFMCKKVEEFIKEKTGEAEECLKEKNKLREMQGLREKMRISEEILEEVFTIGKVK